MDWEQYKVKLKNADNDGLLRALVEQAKMMDEKVESYDAVKLIKAELLARLEGEPVVAEKDWREELTEDEEQAVLAQYQHGVNIRTIQKGLGDNVTQKAVRLAVGKVYGTQTECARCGTTTHIAHVIGERLSCIECGTVKFGLY